VNVTASKMMLGVSLAALAYCSWDHIFPDKPAEVAATSAPAPKGNQLSAGMVNRTIVLKLVGDPFNSVPLGMTLDSGEGLPNESGKDLGELNLQGVMVTLRGRAAVINGKALYEGQTMQTPTGATIRANRVGVGFCIVEGAGRMVMLKVNEGAGGKNEELKKSKSPDGKNTVAGVNPQAR
jgi:hypothetical protein